MKHRTLVSKRLRSYGTAAVGTTAVLATQAEAATVLMPGSPDFNTTLEGIAGILSVSSSGTSTPTTYVNFSIGVQTDKNFRRGTSTSSITLGSAKNSLYFAEFNKNGQRVSAFDAALNSTDNWLYVRNNSDSTKGGWLQFSFGNGSVEEGFSVVKLVAVDSVNEIPTAAGAATAVPEPSALALLSLGASGLLIRRRRVA